MKLRCSVCNYLYDEEKEGTPFRELPPDWRCPKCSAPKSAFNQVGGETVTDPDAPTMRAHASKPSVSATKDMSTEQREELLMVLDARFEENMNRHEGLEWAKVQAKLEANPEKLWSLNEMERTGGEPDVVGYDKKTDEYIFIDCSAESPQGRRNTCYDREAQEQREKKGVYPEGNAVDMAASLGVDLLTEKQYRELQKLGEFDTKTSSWVKTPSVIRKLGGAIFMDRRYNHVFVYHNSAPSFYSSRGFRGVLRA